MTELEAHVDAPANMDDAATAGAVLLEHLRSLSPQQWSSFYSQLKIVKR
jgi:hypothetical protein